MKKESIRETFAVMNNAYCRVPFSCFLDSLEQLGLCQIDLWGGAPHLYGPDMTERRLTALDRELKERGMRLVSYTPEMIAYPYDLAGIRPRLRQRSVDYMKRSVDIAFALGSPFVLAPAGRGEKDAGRRRAWDAMCSSLWELAEYARGSQVRIVLEHLTEQSSPLVNRVSDMEAMLRQVDHPELGCVLDLGQMSLYGDTVAGAFQAVGSRILLVHMMDGTPGRHLAFGDGNLPLEQYAAQLRQAGYQGKITLEINDRCYFPDPHGAISQCVRAIEGWREVS